MRSITLDGEALNTFGLVGSTTSIYGTSYGIAGVALVTNGLLWITTPWVEVLVPQPTTWTEVFNAE